MIFSDIFGPKPRYSREMFTKQRLKIGYLVISSIENPAHAQNSFFK